MSVPKHIYLGNILGATGPMGPTGPTGQSAIGCNSCYLFNPSYFYYLINTNTLVMDPGNANFQFSCWTVGEPVTLSGKDAFGISMNDQVVITSINTVSRLFTIDNLTKFFDSSYPVTMCHGHNVGPTGPSGGPIGPTGPLGPQGDPGECKCCSGVTTTNIDLSNPAVVVGQQLTITTTETDLSCVQGARIRVHDLSSTSFLEGEIYSYIGNQLTFTIDYKKGTISSSNWSFGIAGVVGATGPDGPPGSVMSLNALDRQVIFSDLGEAKGAEIFYKKLYGGLGEEINRLGILTSAPTETLDINGSLKIRNVGPISWPYN